MRSQYKSVLFSLCLLAFLSMFTYANANSLLTNKLEGLSDFSLNQYQSEEKDYESQNISFILPTSLTIIEESAFEGTSITTVDLPENLETIEDNAFANISTLKQVSIPNSTTFIGKDAFKGSNQVTITAAPKSYARAYAQENKIPFNPITRFYAFTPSPQTNSLSSSRAEPQKLFVEGETKDNQKANQTGRMAGDLNADRYENITTFHIQGRSPPMG